jgi:hypothetical protein
MTFATLRSQADVQRGIALARLGRIPEAQVCFVRAAASNPENADAHYNLGNTREVLGQHEVALQSFLRAVELRPRHLEARWNIALLRLLCGELEEGWLLYEERFSLDALHGRVRRFEAPRWTGTESLEGKHILLWAERGLGDTLQFCRYVPLVRDLGACVTFEVQPRLKALLERAFPGVSVIAQKEPAAPVDYHCPLLSLPLVFRTGLETIPADVPYLKAEATRVERWAGRVPSDTEYRVGIAWQGNPEAERNWAQGRSWPLAALAPLARQRGVRLISLQAAPGAEQLDTVDFTDQVVSFGDELDPGADAFVDTAGIMMSLDLVICSDSAVAHLAGALGVPVWVALHPTSDWRWLLDRRDSPWYRTMRLFRQRRAGGWEDVVERICGELKTLVLPTRQREGS